MSLSVSVCLSVSQCLCVSPVELVDVLHVAEQRAHLFRSQRQSAAVDDAAQIILQTHRDTVSGIRPILPHQWDGDEDVHL